MRNEEILQFDFSGWPVPDEFLIEIGRVAALWACLESFLNICLGKLAGFNDRNDPKPFILITHASFPQRLDMLGALCEHLKAEFPNLAVYKKVITKLKSAQTLRNRYMHYGVSYDSRTRCLEMAIGSARGKVKTAVESVAIEDIRRVSIEINEAYRALYKLVLQRDIPPPWKKRIA
jgi:hypothetical protein